MTSAAHTSVLIVGGVSDQRLADASVRRKVSPLPSPRGKPQSLRRCAQRRAGWPSDVMPRTRPKCNDCSPTSNARTVPDVVIYNASARTRGPFVHLVPAEVQHALQVTAFGAFLVAQQAASRMLPKGHGAMLLPAHRRA